MKNQISSEQTVKFYYVDESGDPTLFGHHNKVLLGADGVSRYFMMGLLSIGDPVSLDRELSDLCQQLLNDPYFKGVPSMQPEKNKTARFFHAKDDLPGVRKEVFQLLQKRTDLRFFACIKDKKQTLSYVLSRNQSDPLYRYNENELYDFLVKRLFRDRLHMKDCYEITFAKRFSSDRNDALRKALNVARQRFFEKYHIQRAVTLKVESSTPLQTPCLQAVDYFLWALSRFYVNKEDRFLSLLWPSFRVIIDMDDVRDRPTGAHYSQKKPLTLEKLPPC